MGEKTRTNQEKDSSLPVKIISPNICFQILQLQMNDYKYHYLFTTFVSTLGPRKWMERGSTRLENAIHLCVPGYRDLRPRGLQVQFRQYHCLPSGRRGGRRCAGYPEGHGAISAVREYDSQQIESYTGKKFPCHRESLLPCGDRCREVLA